MKPSCCTRPASPLRRGAEVAGAITSATTLILMPKCPMCIAAYVAAATGLGISVATASYLRSATVIICGAILTLLALKVIGLLLGQPSKSEPPKKTFL